MKQITSNPENTRKLLDHLVESVNRFREDNPEIDDLDLFMAVHNFHVVVILSLEEEYASTTKEQLFYRKMAIDTFRNALENKPAF